MNRVATLILDKIDNTKLLKIQRRTLCNEQEKNSVGSWNQTKCIYMKHQGGWLFKTNFSGFKES